MSLGISLIGKGGLVLVSDSRATIGDPRGLTVSNDTVKKIFGISQKAGLIMAGAGEIGAVLIDEMSKRLNKEDDVDSVLIKIHDVSVPLFTKWFGQPVIAPQGIIRPWPSLVINLAGLSRDGSSKLYILTSEIGFAPSKSTMGFATIGVVPLAIYLLNRLYDTSMNLQNCKKLATYAILETMSQDGKVGGPIQMATITPDKGFCFVEEGEIARIVEEAKTYREHLKKVFVEENP